MCGLVGMAGDLTFKHKAVMKDLLFFNTLRGRDSTGVAAYDMGRNQVELKKVTVPGFEFIGLPFIDNLLSPMVGIWIGHGRARTVGDVSRLNAHPFEVRNDKGGIVLFGAHNGTLKNKHEIERELDGEKFGTDSEALLNLIDKAGPKDALSVADGAWALSFWQSNSGKLHLIRNRERPLYYCYTEDRKTLLWASEDWFLRIACARHGLEIAKSSTGTRQIYECTADTLYSWSVPSFKHNAAPEDKVLPAPTREGGVIGKPEPRFQAHRASHQQGGGGWYGEVDWFADEDADMARLNKPVSQATSEAGKKGKENEGKDALNKVVGFRGQLVDRQLAEEYRRAGCDWCGGPISVGAYGWMDEMNLVCKPCMSDSHVDVDTQSGEIKLRVVEGGKK